MEVTKTIILMNTKAGIDAQWNLSQVDKSLDKLQAIVSILIS